MRKLIMIRTLFTMMLLLLVISVSAQGAFPPPPPSPPPGIPIDGGLLWLLAAGGALGIKKLWDARLKKH